jgi:AsmA protein
MKTLKYILYAVGAVAALLLIAALALALLVDANRFKGPIERAVKESTQRTLKLEGRLHLAFFPSIGLATGQATLSERGSTARFASLRSAQISVGVLPLLHGALVVNGVLLDGLQVDLVRRRDGHSNYEDLLPRAAPARAPAPAAAESKATGAAAPLELDIASVRVENSALTYRDEQTGRSLSVSDFSLRTGRIAPDVPGKLSLAAVLRGKNPALDLRMKLASGYRIAAGGRQISLPGLDAQVTGSAGGVSGLVLDAKGDIMADPARQLYEVSSFRLDARATLGERALKAELSGTLRIDLARSEAAAQLAGRIDESGVKANLAVASFAPARLKFGVDIDRLNLDRYLSGGKPAATAGSAPPSKAAGTAAPAKAADASGNEPLDLSALNALNAEGPLRVGTLTAHRVTLSNLKAQIRLANGRLELNPYSAALYQGTLSGMLSLDAHGNRLALKSSLENVSAGPLLRDLSGRDALEGRGNVALDVTAAGASVDAMKKSLSGTAQVRLHDGAIKGINLAATLRKAKALLGTQSAQDQAADRSQQTDFSELSASFRIRNGVAHNDDLNAKSPFFRIGGAGDIDIGNSRLDYLAKATVVASAKGQGGGDLGQLAGFTVPVRLTGPFEAPKYRVDLAALATELGKSRLSEELKRGLEGKSGQGTGGEAKKLLRGILGH